MQGDGQRGQREIEHGEVETDDEAADGERAERPPAAPAGGHGGSVHDRDHLSVVTLLLTVSITLLSTVKRLA